MICQDGRTARIFFWWKGKVPFLGVVIGWMLTSLILILIVLLCIIIITIITFIIVVCSKYDPHNTSDSSTHSLSSLSRSDTDCILKGAIINIQFIRLQEKQFCLRTGLAAS